MAVNHCAFIDVGSDIYIGGRHDDDAGCQKSASTDAGASGYYPYLVLEGEFPGGVSVLVEKCELPLGHVRELSTAEPGKDDFLDFGIHFPFAADFPCDPEISALKVFHHTVKLF